MQKVKNTFTLTPEQIVTIARAFASEMTQGLLGQKSSLKILPSFLTRPTGNESGHFLALDFGGTNVRTLFVSLAGQGKYRIEKSLSAPLKDPAGKYDLIGGGTDAEALFDFIASQVNTVAKEGSTSHLGHTFSFPCEQIDLTTAVLLNWTKEIKTSGVEGKNVTALLDRALARQGCGTITCRAVINDTVGTLLAAAYQTPHTDIGSICGTGHNTCYLEPVSPLTGRPMIINLESGNFDKLPLTPYDETLDRQSKKPGQQQLEKMVSGRYLGELVRLVLADVSERFADILPSCLFVEPYSLDTKELSVLLADETQDLAAIEAWLASTLKVYLPLEARRLMKEAATLVTTRSAQLAAASYLGILFKIDPEFTQPHTIAIDGSLYEKLPGYAAAIRATLTAALGSKASLVNVILTKDGSGVGAAIAAAIGEK